MCGSFANFLANAKPTPAYERHVDAKYMNNIYLGA